MSAVFFAPRENLWDANGARATTGTVRFFNAGTTTPRSVYSNTALSLAINQPIQADGAGRLPKIYIAVGSYKVVYYSDAAGTIPVYTEDDLDTGIPASGGAVAVANGGTGATTAAGARTNLAAASQTDLTTQATLLAGVLAQIAALPGGAIVTTGTLTRAFLQAGFGSIPVQRSEVAASTALVTCAGTIPYDDTIPQNTEGTQALTGTFTPISATSTLEIKVELPIGNSSSGHLCGALFQDTGANAIAARWTDLDAAVDSTIIEYTHRMASPGTSAVTFAVRVGSSVGTSYVNGNANAAARIGGGTQRASIFITEYLAF